MFKIVKADKDAYITSKVVRGERKYNSNTGGAGTLDLFKLYGSTFSGSSPNTEISRILIHFDLTSIKELVSQGKLDVNDPSFWCKIHLSDVYGGQTTPAKFDVSVFPLSSSFDEGVGKDISYFSDYDACNWITASLGNNWHLPGCSLSVDATSSGDYITSSVSIPNTEATQRFESGEEDLLVDVTKIMSATLTGELPDSGLRISFKNSIENNTQTYFVKRFASRTAYSEIKRPKMTFGFDDSISDDSQNLTFDTGCNLTIYNYSGGSLSNILSGSALSEVTGSNCLVLNLLTEVSGGFHKTQFSGSQFSLGAMHVTGTYISVVNLSSNDPVIKTKIAQSGSVNFIPVWSSIDSTVDYLTGSTLTFSSPRRTSTRDIKNYIVTITDVKDSYFNNEEQVVRVNIFDSSHPGIKLSRIPISSPRAVIRNVFYQIRDAVSGDIVVPFDEEKKSTIISSDSSGMFFKLDATNLYPGRTYVIDVLISHNGNKKVFRDTSPVFKIERSYREI